MGFWILDFGIGRDVPPERLYHRLGEKPNIGQKNDRAYHIVRSQA
ncbi:MAG: hypothetical protein VKJ24_19870 [Synechococcales bacterium]|nr:hypothetical protein [Synechococcales bacterium]